VGGEGADPKEPWKISRFKRHFDNFNAAASSSDVTTVKFIDFLKVTHILYKYCVWYSFLHFEIQLMIVAMLAQL
jgi:hypothetical protein